MSLGSLQTLLPPLLVMCFNPCPARRRVNPFLEIPYLSSAWGEIFPGFHEGWL